MSHARKLFRQIVSPSQVLPYVLWTIRGVDYWFWPRVHEKGHKFYVAGHTYAMKEIDGADIVVKCHSQQGKHMHIYSASLQVRTNFFLYHGLSDHTTALHDSSVCVLFFVHATALQLLFLWLFFSSVGVVSD